MNSKNVDSSFEADWGTVVALILVMIVRSVLCIAESAHDVTFAIFNTKVGTMATTAGVGGGAIFVPVFQALVGFSLKDSTALSQALITAGFLVSVTINAFSPSPLDSAQPLIHLHFVLLLAPMMLVGV
jgi:uncharacterized membrane protein YfcA